jgi:DHA1 family tetracycline resistance protein-like MFS transporter
MVAPHPQGLGTEADGDSPRNTHALTFVFITVLVDTIGFGIVLPVMPALLMELTGETVSQASLDGGYLAFSYAVMQFFFGPVIGNLSDHFGRRPVLLFSLLAFGLDYLVMGLAPSFAWLFLGRMVAGIAGASYTTAYACVADISPPETRAQNFGIVGAAFGVGFILGPALGGLLGGLGPRAPFFAAAGLALVNVIYGYMLFPETLGRESRRTFTWKRANTLGTLASIRRYPTVLGIAAALFLWQFAHQVLPNTFAYYVKLKFDWNELGIGVSLAYAGITMAIVQGGLTRVLVPRLGEHAAGLLGIAAGAAGYLGYAFSSAGWMIYVCMTLAALMGLAFPSMNSIMSRQIPATAQGELQGAVASLYSLTSIMSPLVMTQLFGYFTSAAAPVYFPGAAFAFAAFLTLGSAMLFLRATRRLSTMPAEAREVGEAPQALVD